MFAPGTLVTPSVRLVRPLGAGGMGAVWVAEHLTLHTEVVVKFMSVELAGEEGARSRFSREASSAAAVKSPHVVQMLDHGITDGTPFIVMELLEGEDLRQRLDRERTLPLHVVDQIVTQTCKALAQAHRVSVVHRDIKPDNIFLCKNHDEDIVVKLLDFGIAKANVGGLGLGATKTGTVMGTPFYMSPEQALGLKEVDFRTDLWSLGVVAFEAITGTRAFDGPNIGALAVAITHGTVPVPSQRDASLPASIDAWFARACARDVAGRFGSAKEMAEAFHAALATAAPPSKTVKMSASLAATQPAPAFGTTTSPTSQPDQTTRKAMTVTTKILVGLVAAGAMGVGVYVVTAGNRFKSTAASSSGSSSSTPVTAGVDSPKASATAAAIPRYPCGSDIASHCEDNTQAWCNAEHHPIACCARGLVAVGADGICDCAPGGYTGDAGPPNCRRAPSDDIGIDGAIASMRPRFRVCFNDAADGGLLAGKMRVGIELTPEGSVFSTRVLESQMPSADAQRCILDVVRTMQLAPPPGGTWKLVIPIGFGSTSSDSDAGKPDTAHVMRSTPSAGLSAAMAEAAAVPALSEGDIQRVVQQRSTSVKRTCWERLTSTEPNVNVTLHLTISATGSVQSSKASSNDPIVGACIENAARDWVFPASSGSTTVDIPFHFLRQ